MTKRALLVSCSLAVLSCSRDLAVPAGALGAPSVAAVTPASAFAGERVVLTGARLGATLDEVRVAFGNAAAVRPLEVAEGGTRVVVEVPPSAQAGPLSITTLAGSAASTLFTLAGPGQPAAMRLAPARADLRLIVASVHPSTRTDGTLVRLAQNVRGARRPALALLRADGSFTVIARDVLAAWADDAGTYAYVVRITLGRVLVQRLGLLGGEVQASFDLRGSLHPAEEEFSVVASPDGSKVVVFSLSDLSALTWSGGALALQKSAAVIGTPTSPPPLLYVSDGRFLAITGVAVQPIDFAAAATFAPLWKPLANTVSYGLVRAAASAQGDVVFTAPSPVRLEVWSAPKATDPFVGASFTQQETIPLLLADVLNAVAVTADGQTLAFASGSNLTVVARKPTPTPLATTSQGSLEALAVQGQVFLHGHLGGVNGVSARTGAVVTSAEPRALLGTPVLAHRVCAVGDPKATWFNVVVGALGTVVTLDPTTLLPTACEADEVPGTGRALAISAGATLDERVIATEAAAGGLELWRTDANGAVIGAPVRIPKALIPWGATELESGAQTAGTDRFLRRSEDGTRLLVTWITETLQDTHGAVLPLDRPWTALEPVADLDLGFSVSDAFLDQTGLWVFGFGTGVFAPGPLAQGSLVRIFPLPDSVNTVAFAVPSGDSLSRDRVLGLSGKGVLKQGQALALSRTDGTAEAVFSFDLKLPYRGRVSPNRRKVVWLDGLASSSPYQLRGLRLDTGGVPVGFDAPIDLPALSPGGSESVNRGFATGFAWSEDGSRLLVTLPTSDIAYSIE